MQGVNEVSFFSFSFVIFVLATIFLYYHPKLRAFQVRILVIASICFYAIDQFKFLPLLIAAAAGTYIFLHSAQRGSRNMLIFGVIFNLALLAFFKYKFLLISSGNSSIERDSIETLLYLPIPVGISFFVFHNISLLADYGKLGGKRLDASFEKIMLYIIFFPQLVSGPITRAFQFFPQINQKKME
jgi:alginate O-acetyltransferase complex protein AlgI